MHDQKILELFEMNLIYKHIGRKDFNDKTTNLQAIIKMFKLVGFVDNWSDNEL